MFTQFDYVCKTTGVTKVETVGNVYMACAGLKDSGEEENNQGTSQADRVLQAAFGMIEHASGIRLKSGRNLDVKIGVHSGEVTAGVVGFHKPQFSLVGDTINTASRLCSTLQRLNSVQISP